MTKKKNKKKKSIKKDVKKKSLMLLGVAGIFLIAIIIFGINNVFTDGFVVKNRTYKVSQHQKDDSTKRKTVGWVRVQGTNIDYPVLYAPGYNFEYETDDFAWTEADFEELNNMIYISGHNIKNQSAQPLITHKNHNRFEQLMSFTYYNFAKDNQFIQYTFKGKNYVYRIYSVAYIDSSDMDIYNKAPYPEENVQVVIDDTKEKSIFDYDVDVESTDKIISLTTCTKMFGEFDDTHFTVNARLLREGESMELANVRKNEQYKIIEEKLKGGDSYDEA